MGDDAESSGGGVACWQKVRRAAGAALEWPACPN